MRRAIAGVGILVVASLFILLAPVVPASAHSSANGGTHGCPLTSTACILVGSNVQGYGSLSFYMAGVGGTWFNGSYNLATTSNFTVSVNA